MRKWALSTFCGILLTLLLRRRPLVRSAVRSRPPGLYHRAQAVRCGWRYSHQRLQASARALHVQVREPCVRMCGCVEGGVLQPEVCPSCGSLSLTARCPYILPHTSCFSSRPRIGMRMYVRSNCKRFLSALVAELTNWYVWLEVHRAVIRVCLIDLFETILLMPHLHPADTTMRHAWPLARRQLTSTALWRHRSRSRSRRISATRVKSANLLKLVVIFMEEHLTMEVHTLLPAFIKALSFATDDGDKELRGILLGT